MIRSFSTSTASLAALAVAMALGAPAQAKVSFSETGATVDGAADSADQPASTVKQRKPVPSTSARLIPGSALRINEKLYALITA